jgi:hypothetical protein
MNSATLPQPSAPPRERAERPEPAPVRSTVHRFGFVRFFVAALLLVAAGLKVHELALLPSSASKVAPFGQAAFEAVLALWLIGGIHARAARWVTLGCFILFSIIALYRGLRGDASCGCFGPIQVSPWITLGLDLLVVTGLILWRPGESRSLSIRRIGATAALAVLILAGSVGVYIASRPATLDADGLVSGEGQLVIVEPQEWLGKRIPLLRHIEKAQVLERGKWLLLFYKHDCPACVEAAEAFYERTILYSDGRSLAVVEIPPYGSDGHLGTEQDLPFQFLRLSDRHEWFLATPTFVLLDDGRVMGVKEQSGEMQYAVVAASSKSAESDQRTAMMSAAADSEAAADWRAIVHDFGYVEPGESTEATITLFNPTDTPLIIRGVRSECECIQIPNPPAQIETQSTVDTSIMFDAPEDVSNYSRRVVLQTDQREHPTITIQVKARLGLPLRVEPEVLELGAVARGEQRREEITIHNDGKEPVRLLYGTSDNLGSVPLVPRERIEPRGSLAVPLQLLLIGEGDKTISMQIQTSHPAQRTVTAWVKYTVEN